MSGLEGFHCIVVEDYLGHYDSVIASLAAVVYSHKTTTAEIDDGQLSWILEFHNALYVHGIKQK